MSVENRRFFIIKEGAARANLDESNEKRKERVKALDEFKKEIKAKNVWYTNSHIGFSFKGQEIIKGWREHPYIQAKDETVCTPKRNSKKGKELADRIVKMFDIYNAQECADKFFDGDPSHFCMEDGQTIMVFASYGKVADIEIVSIHKDAKAKPIDGMLEIKPSEYLRIVEDFEEAKVPA